MRRSQGGYRNGSLSTADAARCRLGWLAPLLLLGSVYALVSEIGAITLGLGVVLLGWTGTVGRGPGRSA
jgi:hypothetical protein